MTGFRRRDASKSGSSTYFIEDRDGSRFINLRYVAIADVDGDYVHLRSLQDLPLGSVTLAAWQRHLGCQDDGAGDE